MLRNLRTLRRSQRVLVFVLLFGGVLLALLAVSAVLIFGALGTTPRAVAMPQAPGVTVREFAILPGEDVYPAAVAVAPDGRIYTGSYKTGAIYVISTDGTQVTEVPGSREAIGAAAGLAFAPDGSLLIVDHRDSDVRTSGGLVKRLSPDGVVSDFASIEDERGFVLPHDVTVDAAGSVYVSDRGRDEVWRFNPDGTGGAAWWTSPQVAGNLAGYEPNGLVFDPVTNAILITDGAQSIVYRVAVNDGTTQTLYEHPPRSADAPGFGGVTVAPDGTIYVAALAQNQIARLDGETLTYLAMDFRGSSDLAFVPPNQLIVTNFDQRSLVFTLERPRLPFALDMVELAIP